MKKFIIIKKAGHYKHIKGYNSHEAITYDNGFNYYNDVIETGIIDNGNIFFIECRDKKHLAKREYTRGLFDPGIIRARAAETYYIYNLGQYKTGD
jgi:hypothetical protein